MASHRKTTTAILWTTLLAGSLDIATAIIQFYFVRGKSPLTLFRFIASGVFGSKALSGGILMALFGLLLHYIIALIFTTIFFLFYPSITSFIKNKIIAAVLYGLLVWAVMNLVVVPLSNTPKMPFNPKNAFVAMIILITMIGFPISLMAHRFFKSLATIATQP